MIFEILDKRTDGTPIRMAGDVPGIVFREIRWGDAWEMLDMLHNANLAYGVYICCAQGYENALFFERN